jgi:hypothetical protein
VSRSGTARVRGAFVVAAVVVSTALGVVGVGAVAHAEPEPGALVPGTPCTATARACADLTALQAWLLDDGEVVRGPVPISIGDDGADASPVGVFEVEWKHDDHISGESGAPMPFAVFFAPGGIAFHEGSLKTHSRGCIRLVREEAEAFYEHLDMGDEVQVHEGTPAG